MARKVVKKSKRKKVKKSYLEIYKEAGVGDWRWRVQDRNGEILLASTEGYVDRVDCMKNLTRVSKILREDVWTKSEGETDFEIDA